MNVIHVAMTFLLAAPGVTGRLPWPARVAELRTLLQQKRFAELEKAVVESQLAFERSPANEDEAWASIGAFLESDAPTEKALSEWVAQSPGSYAALGARGLYYEGTGWSERGTQWVKDTTSGQMRSMNSMHALGAADCEKALSIRPALVACHVALINIAKAEGDEEQVRRRYDVARRATPQSVLVATARLESLTPRWGGSYGAMQEFLRALGKTPAGRTPAGRALAGHAKADQASMAATDRDYAGAVQFYGEAIALGGGTAAYYAGRGMNAERLGHSADALKDYDRAIETAPYGWPYSEAKLPVVLAARAGIRHKQGEQAAAETDIRDALTLSPTDPYATQWARVIFYKGKRP